MKLVLETGNIQREVTEYFSSRDKYVVNRFLS